MKKTITLFIIVIGLNYLNANAQINYQISFAGTGASTTVDSVKVENLTQGIDTIISGSDILNLTITTEVGELSPSTSLRVTISGINVYPNPMTGNCLIEFEATAQGNATLELYDIAGKRILQSQEILTKGQHTYSLSGVSSGIFFLKVESENYSYTAKILSGNGYRVAGNAEMKHVNQSTIHSPQTTENNSLNKVIEKSLKSNKSLVDMAYTTGDQLKLTGMSGIYSSVVMLIPTQSQTITFNFVEDCGSVTDYDGNVYNTIKIGSQCWMKENLKTTRYKAGAAIPNETDNTAWANLITPGYCWYNNDSVKNSSIYGALYNWYAVNTGTLCPAGWHIPTDPEWTVLTDYLGGASIAGGKMKEAGIAHWAGPNTGATNESGFSGLPGGYRYQSNGTFGGIVEGCYWWTATASNSRLALYVRLVYNSSDLVKYNGNKERGYSVRCLKD